MLNPTPPDRMVDPQGRPYFLWDTDMSMAMFRERLSNPDVEVRAYLVGKLMRQAKPDDVFTFVSFSEIADLWPQLERYLGKSRPFWTAAAHRGHGDGDGEDGGLGARARTLPGWPRRARARADRAGVGRDGLDFERLHPQRGSISATVSGATPPSAGV
jgi:hypothetical protein